MATDVTVESSPTEVLAALTPAQHKTWRETGELPEPKAARAAEPENPAVKTDGDSSTPAKTATAESAKKDGEIEKPAASVPAEEPKVRPGAEGRIKQLLSENKRLEQELETLRKQSAPAPAKIEEVAKPRRNDVDVKTGAPLYADDEAYDEAYEKYIAAKVTKDVEVRHAKAQAEAKVAEMNRINLQRWTNSVALAKERHADFDKVCGVDEKGAFQNVEIKGIKEKGPVDSFCLESEIGAEMLYYFASHPGEVVRLDAKPIGKAWSELTRLEDKVSASTVQTTSKTGETKTESSTTQVTRAPAPAASVSGNATAPRNEVDAAIEAEDFARYKRAANEEEFNRRKKAS